MGTKKWEHKEGWHGLKIDWRDEDIIQAASKRKRNENRDQARTDEGSTKLNNSQRNMTSREKELMTEKRKRWRERERDRER